MASAWRIDVALNAVGIPHVQGTPPEHLSLEDYPTPIDSYLRTNALTAKAVSPHMAQQGSGVIFRSRRQGRASRARASSATA